MNAVMGEITQAGGMARLVSAVQELSLTRDLEGVMRVVRRVARELCGADGATFVLRDEGKCFYADEDAIEPLWKGKRFPMDACVSGWAMNRREAVMIEDIYVDPRVPIDAYRPTFVKSLAMVPIRTAAPIGAIGNYWATRHKATEEELKLLQALADSTSIAMENVQLFSELESRVRARTAQLEVVNRELEAFSCAVSHDLRAPLRSIDGFGRLLEEDLGPNLDAAAQGHLTRIRAATARMSTLIDDMLTLARASRGEVRTDPLDLSAIARGVADELAIQRRGRRVEFAIASGMAARGDASLVRAVLENLMGNAFKFTARVPAARIEVGSRDTGVPGERAFFVRDNGAGFDMKYAPKLFAPFQRLHTEAEFPGTGVGLATVKRIVSRHGGRVWVDSHPGEGATFSFTLTPAASAPTA
jgi:signal transduction histidine kinase